MSVIEDLHDALLDLGVQHEICVGPLGEIGVLDVVTDDIIGSGETECEALADAIATVRGWESRQ